MGRGLSAESKDLCRRILDVFEREHPNPPRRVAYVLFGNRANAMAKKIGALCGRLLDAGDLPLEWYDDSSRSEVEPYVVEDVASLVAMKRGVPDFDPWRTQPVCVRVWSEKSVGGTLDPVLQKLAVPFLNTSGWNSRKKVMEAAHLARIDPRRSIILYAGDHDAAGLRMSEIDLPRRFAKYGAEIEIRRVAITREDFEALRRQGLTDPVKPKDPNRNWYRQRTGFSVGVELEAMPAPELRARVEQAIRDCIVDLDAWNRVITASQAVRDAWQAHVDAWPRPAIAIPGLDPR